MPPLFTGCFFAGLGAAMLTSIYTSLLLPFLTFLRQRTVPQEAGGHARIFRLDDAAGLWCWPFVSLAVGVGVEFLASRH